MKAFVKNNTTSNTNLAFQSQQSGAITPNLPQWLVVSNHRILLTAFVSIVFLASVLTLLTTTQNAPFPSPPSLTVISSNTLSALPAPLFDALLAYAIASNSTAKMPEADVRTVAGVLRRRSPCNLLVFGLGHETPLWRALNHGGRTVFIDENEYYIKHIEGQNPPGLEAYDVAYTTRNADLPDLIAGARRGRREECRPVQNLLFSDCRLAINDLPNDLYGVAWDVILVDGPRGFSPESPGRMSAIFTAGVMARSGGGVTDVLVHDFEREGERVSSEEFLCRENLVLETGTIGHFVVSGAGGRGADDGEFCGSGGPATERVE